MRPSFHVDQDCIRDELAGHESSLYFAKQIKVCLRRTEKVTRLRYDGLAQVEVDGSEAIVEALMAARRRTMEGLTDAELNERIERLQREFASRTGSLEKLGG